jgi:tRNA(Ile2) C34 agmatinyltransferase TiaS
MMPDRNLEPEPRRPTARCPVCGGRDLKAASKVIDPNTYWRCLSCGEVSKLDNRTAARTGYRR